MSLKQQLKSDMKVALKARDSDRLNTIRFLLSEMKNVEIDHGELDDAGVQQVVRRQIKQIKEARDQFASGGRTDLVESEAAKLAVLERYLPQQLSEAELRQLVQAVIDQAPERSFKSIMPQAMSQVAGRADGKTVAAMVQQLLA